MAGLHLISTYSSDSDEDEYNEKEDINKTSRKYIDYIIVFRLLLKITFFVSL